MLAHHDWYSDEYILLAKPFRWHTRSLFKQEGVQGSLSEIRRPGRFLSNSESIGKGMGNEGRRKACGNTLA